MATNWSCLWEEWGRLEDKCFSSIASSWQSDTLSNGTSAQVSLSVVQHFLDIRNSWQHCLAMSSPMYLFTCWHHNLQRDSCYICSCVPDTCLGCKQSHGAFPIVNWYCVCFSLPTVIVSMKRAKHSRSPAVPRKVIFDWFQSSRSLSLLFSCGKNNKDGKIWRLDVK